MFNDLRKISILGSTGSIGQSTLAVVREQKEKIKVMALSCNNNISLLAEQINEFKPKLVALGKGKTGHLKELLQGNAKELSILEGEEGFDKVAEFAESDLVVAALVGAAGIKPVIKAIRAKKDIALANKEPLVMAGKFIMKEAAESKVKILPVDSEHNAVFQCLQGYSPNDIDTITLTASGGPFYQRDLAEFSKITLEDALNHPNWSMGQKISIDSATMMNKCLEVIEARWLFNIAPHKIKVLIHPQSIIHSMVTFKDSSTICQASLPDMRVPISFCLAYPEKLISGCNKLDLSEINTLTFQKPDLEKFPSIQMCYDVLKLDGGAPAALNGANEELVDYFINNRIPFTHITETLKSLIKNLKTIFYQEDFNENYFLKECNSVEAAIESDNWGRNFCRSKLAI